LIVSSAEELKKDPSETSGIARSDPAAMDDCLMNFLRSVVIFFIRQDVGELISKVGFSFYQISVLFDRRSFQIAIIKGFDILFFRLPGRAHNSKSDKHPVGHPPLALGYLRVPLIPCR